MINYQPHQHVKCAVTLVHKGAMPIAIHAVSSFARNFTGEYRLRIHSDGSLNIDDESALLAATGDMPAEMIRPKDRAPIIKKRTENYPNTRELLTRGTYFTKLQLPVCENTPYFYFDSDIVWLAPVDTLIPPNARNAFSTESWSWYYGISNDHAWICDRIPRRVNSGFYYLADSFPFDRMENMLNKNHFDPEIPYNTDQEIMAYLYRDLEYYHPEDLKRSRRGVIYDLTNDPAAALHFPGGMWQPHLNQMTSMIGYPRRDNLKMRYKKPVPITRLELLRMRSYMAICTFRPIQGPLNLIRKLRIK